MGQQAFVFIFSLVCSTTNISAQSNKLNGTWVPVKPEIDGNPLPPATFEKQKLIINDTAYTFIAGSIDKGIISYKVGNMNMYGKEGINAGRHITAGYKFAKDQLVISYNLAGDKSPKYLRRKASQLIFLQHSKRNSCFALHCIVFAIPFIGPNNIKVILNTVLNPAFPKLLNLVRSDYYNDL